MESTTSHAGAPQLAGPLQRLADGARWHSTQAPAERIRLALDTARTVAAAADRWAGAAAAMKLKLEPGSRGLAAAASLTSPPRSSSASPPAAVLAEEMATGPLATVRLLVLTARALADAVAVAGMKVVAGGTDSHLMVVDLTPKDVSGKAAEDSLGRANITCSRSTIPFDPRPPAVSSGVRLGTPAGTTRGFGPAEFRRIGQLIGEVVDGLAANGEEGNAEVEARVRSAVLDLTARFPIYG